MDAREALKNLYDAMIANDAAIDGTPPDYSDEREPNGEDYNTLFDLVLDAARSAGIYKEE